MAKKTKTIQIGRSADTGFFTSVETAQTHPKTHVVETIKKTPATKTKKKKK